MTGVRLSAFRTLPIVCRLDPESVVSSRVSSDSVYHSWSVCWSHRFLFVFERFCQVRCLRFDPSQTLAPSSCVASVDMCFYYKCGLRPVILKYGIVRVVYALEFLLSTVQILRRSTLSRWSSFAESFAHHFWRKTNLLHTHV